MLHLTTPLTIPLPGLPARFLTVSLIPAGSALLVARSVEEWVEESVEEERA